MGVCEIFQRKTPDLNMKDPETPLLIEKLGKEPVSRCCPVCKIQESTKVTPCVRMPIGWLIIILLFPIGLLVLCCDIFKEFKHACCHCGFPLGSYEPPFQAQVFTENKNKKS